MTGSTPLRRLPVRVAVTVVAGLTLAACSSSGSSGGAPSQSQILKKLKSDSAVSSQLGQLSSISPKLKNEAYTCIAKVIHNDVKASSSRAYVNGSKSIQSLASSSSDSKVKSDLQTCITNKAKSSS